MYYCSIVVTPYHQRAELSFWVAYRNPQCSYITPPSSSSSTVFSLHTSPVTVLRDVNTRLNSQQGCKCEPVSCGFLAIQAQHHVTWHVTWHVMPRDVTWRVCALTLETVLPLHRISQLCSLVFLEEGGITIRHYAPLWIIEQFILDEGGTSGTTNWPQEKHKISRYLRFQELYLPWKLKMWNKIVVSEIAKCWKIEL